MKQAPRATPGRFSEAQMMTPKKPTTRTRAKAKAKAPELVRMIRPEHYGRPFTADVHPAEIENYRAGGYRLESEVEVEG